RRTGPAPHPDKKKGGIQDPALSKKCQERWPSGLRDSQIADHVDRVRLAHELVLAWFEAVCDLQFLRDWPRFEFGHTDFLAFRAGQLHVMDDALVGVLEHDHERRPGSDRQFIGDKRGLVL